MFYCFQLHLIRLSSLTRQDVFSLEIAVNHDNGRCIIVQFPDNGVYVRHPGKLTGVLSPMPGYNLVPAFITRSHNNRNKHAVFFYTFNCFRHALIIADFERMIGEIIKL